MPSRRAPSTSPRSAPTRARAARTVPRTWYWPASVATSCGLGGVGGCCGPVAGTALEEREVREDVIPQRLLAALDRPPVRSLELRTAGIEIARPHQLLAVGQVGRAGRAQSFERSDRQRLQHAV